MMSNMTERTNEPPNSPNEPGQAERTTVRSPQQVADLREQLAIQRELTGVNDEHEIEQRTAKVRRTAALADLAEQAANDRRSRRSRRNDAASGVSVADLYRRAAERGTNAYVRSQITQSAEMRSLRVAAVRRTALIVGIPVMLAFAAWSTSNVQAGVMRISGTASRATSIASWLVEPAIITIVALIIIGQAVLRSSGGGTKYTEAELIKFGALMTSLSLAIIGGWPAHSGWSGTITALPHGVGPIGCAITAYLISLFDRYVSQAKPWENAPKLADMNIVVAANIANTIGTVRGEPIANTLGTVRAQQPSSEPANELASAEPAAAATGSAIVPTEIMDRVPVTNTEQRTNIERTNTRTSTEIDAALIETISERWPDWRTNVPPARGLAELLGYSSSSTGAKIRKQLIMTITEDQD